MGIVAVTGQVAEFAWTWLLTWPHTTLARLGWPALGWAATVAGWLLVVTFLCHKDDDTLDLTPEDPTTL